jgi:hypothetical protein
VDPTARKLAPKIIKSGGQKAQPKMTKFFMPGKSSEQAELLYQGWRNSIALKTTERRILTVTFWDNELRKTVKATVGQPDPCEGRVVKGILESSDRYLVWVEGRGDDNMIIGKNEVRGIEEFEP